MCDTTRKRYREREGVGGEEKKRRREFVAWARHVMYFRVLCNIHVWLFVADESSFRSRENFRINFATESLAVRELLE